MKIKQQPKFQPITITLETREELEALLIAIMEQINSGKISYGDKDLLFELYGWITIAAKL